MRLPPIARWAGKELPSEAEWHRAACGTRSGGERAYPWGAEAPSPRGTAILISQRWDPVPVGSYPEGNSDFGVADLVGNGWEWTRTPFAPFPGFQPFSFYPGYSANFFDGKHFVMKGGSPRTAACMLRRSFRNWFQPHYPYVYATFRCVEALTQHDDTNRGDIMATAVIAQHSRPDLAGDVRAGLCRRGQKELPSKYLYDEVGSALFEVISVLPEYGLTRADERLLRRHAADIVARLKPHVLVAELGSGSGKKTRWLLEALARRQRTTYCPIEISPTALARCESELGQIDCVSIVGFERPYLDGLLAAAARRDERRSSAGAVSRQHDRKFRSRRRRALSHRSAPHPVSRRCAAARHGPGKTAAATARRLRRSAGSHGRVQPESAGANQSRAGRGFRSGAFRHEARYNSIEQRVEMHLALDARSDGHDSRARSAPSPS